MPIGPVKSPLLALVVASLGRRKGHNACARLRDGFVYIPATTRTAGVGSVLAVGILVGGEGIEGGVSPLGPVPLVGAVTLALVVRACEARGGDPGGVVTTVDWVGGAATAGAAGIHGGDSDVVYWGRDAS